MDESDEDIELEGATDSDDDGGGMTILNDSPDKDSGGK